jgi:transcriptional regulator with XRE-family HTH domain
MTDLCAFTHARPVAASGLQEGLDFSVEIGRHSGILVKDSFRSKEHFPSRPLHARPVAVKDINQVVADNLQHWMEQRKPSAWTQTELAEKAGVAQKTISNYLNPEQRAMGAKGKQGSPKLFELDLIARALGIEVWQLTRAMSEQQRAAYDAIEKAYKQLLDGVTPGVPPDDQARVDSVRAAMKKRSRPARKRDA